MKKLFFSIAIVSILGSNLHAQTAFHDAAQDAATIICNCVNKTYKSLDDMLYDETGEKGKKFKIKNLREEFKEAQKIPVKEQKKYLHKRFTEWKGDLEQVDDVMIIGIEL